jgi:acid phosphatase
LSYAVLIGLSLAGSLFLPALHAGGFPVRAATAEAQGAQPRLPRPDHIVIVFEENKDYTQIIGAASAPYINALASQGAVLTQFYAAHHPSQPNYIEFFAGENLGLTTDACPPTNQSCPPSAPQPAFAAPNLAASLLTNNLTFLGYAEDLPSDALTCCAGQYARKHCPWINFKFQAKNGTWVHLVDYSKNFREFPHDAAGFANLPTVAVVIPNLIGDMHSLPATAPRQTQAKQSIPEEVRNGDRWLQVNLDAYAQWAKTHNSLLVITWDESSNQGECTPPCATKPPQNRIATLVVGAMVQPHVTSSKPYNHQSLLRTILDMYGLPLFGTSQTASPITDVWQ